MVNNIFAKSILDNLKTLKNVQFMFEYKIKF